MTTFITSLESTNSGLRVAVKDLLDVADLPTTSGSRAFAEVARPAVEDAVCLRELRRRLEEGTARLVGKANLHELAYGISGINPWFGTPVNPLGADLVPGGSSSGSAVAVADDQADVAIGTDTGGSIRIPAACCGVAGLKTTWGRISLDGVRPLAPSMDTVGPMARDVRGLVAGMQLLEKGFELPATDPPALRVGRLYLPAQPAVDQAIDRAVARSGCSVRAIELPTWATADRATLTLLNAEAWKTHTALVRGGATLGPDVAERLKAASTISPTEIAAANEVAAAWRAELSRVFETVDLLATPVLADRPPPLSDPSRMAGIRHTAPVNLAGLPALALPVPAEGLWGGSPGGRGSLPASLQLIGPAGSEGLLLQAGSLIESSGGLV